MSHPKVSVIMNCRNSARFLAEAIESVYAQTFDDWEIVFWDNLSTDDSATIARRYAGKLRYFRGLEPLPLGAARNAAIAEARGEYVALLDCDDLWLPEKLAEQVSLLDGSSSEVALTYADCYFIDDHGRPLGYTAFQRVPVPSGDPFFALLTGRNFIPCLTAAIRRELVAQVGGFSPVLTYSEELDLFLRLLRHRRVIHSLKPLAKYRVHSNNLTGRGSPGTTLETIALVRTYSRQVGLSPYYRLAVVRRLAELYGKLVVQYAQRGELPQIVASRIVKPLSDRWRSP